MKINNLIERDNAEYVSYQEDQPHPHGHMSLLKKTRPGETYGRGDEVARRCI